MGLLRMEPLRILFPIRQLRIIVLTPQQFRAPDYCAEPVTIWQHGDRARFLTWSGYRYAGVKPLQHSLPFAPRAHFNLSMEFSGYSACVRLKSSCCPDGAILTPGKSDSDRNSSRGRNGHGAEVLDSEVPQSVNSG